MTLNQFESFLRSNDFHVEQTGGNCRAWVRSYACDSAIYVGDACGNGEVPESDFDSVAVAWDRTDPETRELLDASEEVFEDFEDAINDIQRIMKLMEP